MLDLQKAVDTVGHNILCSKLNVMGVQSVDWFESYLTDRVQFVSVNSTISEPMNVSCGVSQGSIMGSLLFFTYVNDMSISIDGDCKLILYANWTLSVRYDSNQSTDCTPMTFSLLHKIL
jgi:hypothetical protein